jgi:hypothetical protein
VRELIEAIEGLNKIINDDIHVAREHRDSARRARHVILVLLAKARMCDALEAAARKHLAPEEPMKLRDEVEHDTHKWRGES